RDRVLPAPPPSRAEAPEGARAAPRGAQAERPGRDELRHPRPRGRARRQDRDDRDRAQGAGPGGPDRDPVGATGGRRRSPGKGAGEVVSRSVLYRELLFAALAVAAVVFLLPTFVRPAPAWWPWQRPVRLGLDLQGGTHLLYGVDIEQAID